MMRLYTKLGAISAWLLLSAITCAQHPDADAAKIDRAKYCPPEDYKYVYYLTTHPYTGEAAQDLERAMKLAIAGASKQVIIERCAPVKIGDGLYRMDLRLLKWRVEDWLGVVQGERYPYYDAHLTSLIIRADWLTAQLTDLQESDAYFRLFFEGRIPKTRDEILKEFNVGWQPELTWGMIEGQSGVSKQGVRLLQSFPVPRGYAWGTKDILEVSTEKDFLEHLDLKSPHDGEEWILSMLKMSTTANKRGFLQFYFLSNGQGSVVPRAPVDLVEDKTEFRGLREIRAPGSCIQCHTGGLNEPTRNELKEHIKSGVDVYADYESRDQIEAFHLGDILDEIDQDNDGYQTMVTLLCGCTSAEASASFKAAINRYDAPLDLLQTAEETYLTVEQCTKILALNGDLPARLAALPQGGKLSRDSFEEYFVDFMYAAKGERKLTRKN